MNSHLPQLLCTSKNDRWLSLYVFKDMVHVAGVDGLVYNSVLFTKMNVNSSVPNLLVLFFAKTGSNIYAVSSSL